MYFKAGLLFNVNTKSFYFLNLIFVHISLHQPGYIKSKFHVRNIY